MVSNGFDTLEDSLSLLWSIVTFLGKAFPLLLLRHLLDASLIFVARMVRSPTRVPASRKRERVDTPLTLKGLTQKRHTIFCNIPGSYAVLLFTALDLASVTSHIQNWVFFLLWLHPFILSGVISPLISSVLGTY